MDRTLKLACQSYRPRDMVCGDGFIQTPACYGARCHACGDWAADRKPPNCLRDDLPSRWLTDAGSPLFFKPLPPPPLPTEQGADR